MRRKKETKEGKKEVLLKRQESLAWKMMNLRLANLATHLRNKSLITTSFYSMAFFSSITSFLARITREFEKIIDESSKDGAAKMTEGAYAVFKESHAFATSMRTHP